MEMSFIGDCVRHHEAAKAVATEWQYVAIVLDRLLLWVSPQGWGGQLQSKKRQIVAFCRLFVAFLGGDKKLQRDF